MIKVEIKNKVYFGKTWYEIILWKIVDGEEPWKVGKAEFKGEKESWKKAFGRAREIARRKLG